MLDVMDSVSVIAATQTLQSASGSPAVLGYTGSNIGRYVKMFSCNRNQGFLATKY
jgi:hypothetical protein